MSPSFLTIFLSTNLELISSPLTLAASAKTNVIQKYPHDWAFFASENKTQRLKLYREEQPLLPHVLES